MCVHIHTAITQYQAHTTRNVYVTSSKHMCMRLHMVLIDDGVMMVRYMLMNEGINNDGIHAYGDARQDRDAWMDELMMCNTDDASR